MSDIEYLVLPRDQKRNDTADIWTSENTFYGADPATAPTAAFIPASLPADTTKFSVRARALITLLPWRRDDAPRAPCRARARASPHPRRPATRARAQLYVRWVNALLVEGDNKGGVKRVNFEPKPKADPIAV